METKEWKQTIVKRRFPEYTYSLKVLSYQNDSIRPNYINGRFDYLRIIALPNI